MESSLQSSDAAESSEHERSSKSSVALNWLWHCSSCNGGPFPTTSAQQCSNCRHWRCKSCPIQQLQTRSNDVVHTHDALQTGQAVEIDNGVDADHLLETDAVFSLQESKGSCPSSSDDKRKEPDHFERPVKTLGKLPLMIGDSVGFKGSKHSVALGPVLEFSGKLYWLVTADTFAGAFSGSKIPFGIKLVHPAEVHCRPGETPREIGTLKYWSGSSDRCQISYYHQRINPGSLVNRYRVVPNWALVQVQDSVAASNRFPCISGEGGFATFQEVNSFYTDDARARVVKVIGQSSELQYAQVCEVAASMDPDSSVGKRTAQLYLEDVMDDVMESPERISPGWENIGASIIDDETGMLSGIVTGGNPYFDYGGSSMDFFAQICDILDDIYKTCPELGLAKLPGGKIYKTDLKGVEIVEDEGSDEVPGKENSDEEGSMVESVFSDEESMSSQSSVQAVEVQALREAIASLFIAEPNLTEIFTMCLHTGGIGAGLMTTELRRALRVMGRALSLDSKTREQQTCSRRIKRDARYIADAVRRSCDPEYAGRRLNIDLAPLSPEDRHQKITIMLQRGQVSKETPQVQQIERNDESDSEDDDQIDINTAEQERLEREVSQRIRELENFILRSDHMQALKSNLQAIHHRDPERQEFHQHLKESVSEAHGVECEGKVSPSSQSLLPTEVEQVMELGRTLPEIVEKWFPQWFDFLWEAPVPTGATRIRWTCTCGKELYDDHYSLQEGQLERLRDVLNRPKPQDEDQQPNHHASTTSWTLGAKSWTKAMISTAANAFKSGRGADTGIPLHNPTTIRPPTHTPVIPNTRGNQLFLLFSLESGGEGYAKVLRHAGVEPSKLENDNDLFKFLRQRFYAERKLASRLSLRTVSGIGNCMLRVDFSNFIQNLKRHSNACSSDSVFGCGCWPNPSAVSDYRYIPQTPTEPFLMEKNYLLHHFRNPGCLDPNQTSVICYIPMKKDSQLVGEASKPVTGWGIYFEEDWHWKTISVVITVLMIIVSTALGFTWWFVKSDFSGGWGVASFCVTSATLVVTVLGFMAHKSY